MTAAALGVVAAGLLRALLAAVLLAALALVGYGLLADTQYTDLTPSRPLPLEGLDERRARAALNLAHRLLGQGPADETAPEMLGAALRVSDVARIPAGPVRLAANKEGDA